MSRPGQRLTPVDSEDPLVPARGDKIGLRTVALPGLQSTVALWYLTFDSELIDVGDVGIAEASRPSRRIGVEWTNYVRLSSSLIRRAGPVALAGALRRLRAGSETVIPGALDRVIGGTLTAAAVSNASSTACG